MNTLLFAHVGIRSALLCFRLIGRGRTFVATPRSRLMTAVVLAAALEAAWRLFGSAATPSAWTLDSMLVCGAIPDALLTLGLLASQRRHPRAALRPDAANDDALRVQAERREASAIAARMASLVTDGHAADSTNGLLRDLRSLADGEGATPSANEHTGRPADVTLARIGRELRHLVPESVRVRLDFSEDLGPLRVDARELHDAVLRLADNAMMAMPEGGQLRIRANVSKIGIHNVLDLAPGHWMRVEITDDGVGMTAAQLARCQDPFYTTHPAAAGLGLPAVGAFTRRAGGAMEVNSNLGSGTSVTLWLPACVPSARSAAQPKLLSVLAPKRHSDSRFVTQP